MKLINYILSFFTMIFIILVFISFLIALPLFIMSTFTLLITGNIKATKDYWISIKNYFLN